MQKNLRYRLGLWLFPVCIRSWLANKWFWGIGFWGSSLCVGVLVVLRQDTKGAGWIALIFMSAAEGVICSYFAFRFLSLLLSAMNGGPFRIGDKVRILTGKYKGLTGVVYEEWKDREEVRVDLGESPQSEFDDVFCHVELIRELNNKG
jgi:hypothetical protein